MSRMLRILKDQGLSAIEISSSSFYGILTILSIHHSLHLAPIHHSLHLAPIHHSLHPSLIRHSPTRVFLYESLQPMLKCSYARHTITLNKLSAILHSMPLRKMSQRLLTRANSNK